MADRADASPAPEGGTAPVRSTQALFRHPRHNREIRLGEHSLAYELKRAQRRTIGFVVGEEGLAVSAPRWVGQVDIDRALQSKAAWILRKLRDQAERLQRLDAARIDWRHGTALPYLGAPLLLVVEPGLRGLHLDAGDARAGSPGEPAPGPRLRIGLPVDATPAQIRDAVQRWLQQQARALFTQRCRDYAQRLGVSVQRLRLSSARTRWGSASADGTVRLNWRLIHFAPATIDYVVAHELAHLREMNHSPAFWAVVRTVMPDYEAHRRALKDGSAPVYD